MFVQVLEKKKKKKMSNLRLNQTHALVFLSFYVSYPHFLQDLSIRLEQAAIVRDREKTYRQDVTMPDRGSQTFDRSVLIKSNSVVPIQATASPPTPTPRTTEFALKKKTSRVEEEEEGSLDAHSGNEEKQGADSVTPFKVQSPSHWRKTSKKEEGSRWATNPDNEPLTVGNKPRLSLPMVMRVARD